MRTSKNGDDNELLDKLLDALWGSSLKTGTLIQEVTGRMNGASNLRVKRLLARAERKGWVTHKVSENGYHTTWTLTDEGGKYITPYHCRVHNLEVDPNNTSQFRPSFTNGNGLPTPELRPMVQEGASASLLASMLRRTAGSTSVLVERILETIDETGRVTGRTIEKYERVP